MKAVMFILLNSILDPFLHDQLIKCQKCDEYLKDIALDSSSCMVSKLDILRRNIRESLPRACCRLCILYHIPVYSRYPYYPGF